MYKYIAFLRKRKNKETPRTMKKLATASLIAALAALLSHASPAAAGILTVTSGPTFTPDAAFINNTITVDTTVVGGLVRLVGGATITPDASNQVSIDLSGNYSADVGDLLSAAYSFTVDLNITTPVTYTLSGSAIVFGTPIGFSTSGTLMPGLHKYEGTSSAPAAFLVATAGTYSATLTIDFGSVASPATAGLGTLDLTIQQIDVQLDPLPAMVEAPSQPLNISTRADVGTEDDVLIGGFIVTGTDPKQVVLRAVGPSLAVTGASLLADPFLELHDSTGALLATNDNWMDNSAADQMTLTDNNLVPTNDLESALVMTLDPGAYTAIVRGVNNTTGVALVEVYDINSASTDSKLANISTRGDVGTVDNVMIGGFIVGGGGGGFSSVIVRGIGPSLASAGLTNVLADPMIELHDANGVTIASNDNWMDDPNMQSVIDNNLAPTDANESALFDILPAGAYTAILSGVGDTTGIGLVEAYNID